MQRMLKKNFINIRINEFQKKRFVQDFFKFKNSINSSQLIKI